MLLVLLAAVGLLVLGAVALLGFLQARYARTACRMRRLTGDDMSEVETVLARFLAWPGRPVALVMEAPSGAKAILERDGDGPVTIMWDVRGIPSRLMEADLRRAAAVAGDPAAEIRVRPQAAETEVHNAQLADTVLYLFRDRPRLTAAKGIVVLSMEMEFPDLGEPWKA